MKIERGSEMSGLRRLPRPGMRLAAVVAASVTAAIVLAPGAIGTPLSASAVACGGTHNTVQTEFDMAHGSDIWRAFPAMLRAPELENETGPAHVVVFKGNVDLSGMLAGPKANVPLVTDAVCVVLGDGTVYFYDSVSRAGSTFQ